MRNRLPVTIGYDLADVIGALDLGPRGRELFEQFTLDAVREGAVTDMVLGLSIQVGVGGPDLVAVSLLPIPARPKSGPSEKCVVRIPAPSNHFWKPEMYWPRIGAEARVNGRNGTIADIVTDPDGCGAEFRIVGLDG